jgi:hypothetical protein
MLRPQSIFCRREGSLNVQKMRAAWIAAAVIVGSLVGYGVASVTVQCPRNENPTSWYANGKLVDSKVPNRVQLLVESMNRIGWVNTRSFYMLNGKLPGAPLPIFAEEEGSAVIAYVDVKTGLEDVTLAGLQKKVASAVAPDTVAARDTP